MWLKGQIWYPRWHLLLAHHSSKGQNQTVSVLGGIDNDVKWGPCSSCLGPGAVSKSGLLLFIESCPPTPPPQHTHTHTPLTSPIIFIQSPAKCADVCFLPANPVANANMRIMFKTIFTQASKLLLEFIFSPSDTDSQMSGGLYRLSICLALPVAVVTLSEREGKKATSPRRMMCSRCIIVALCSMLNQELIVNASAETPVSSLHQNKLLVLFCFFKFQKFLLRFLVSETGAKKETILFLKRVPLYI